jgi:hypothetical protein
MVLWVNGYVESVITKGGNMHFLRRLISHLIKIIVLEFDLEWIRLGFDIIEFIHSIQLSFFDPPQSITLNIGSFSLHSGRIKPSLGNRRDCGCSIWTPQDRRQLPRICCQQSVITHFQPPHSSILFLFLHRTTSAIPKLSATRANCRPGSHPQNSYTISDQPA